MSTTFRLGRAICVLGEWLSWPGEALFWIGDRICFRALYGGRSDEDDCPDCRGLHVTWASDGWSAWSEPCASCDTHPKGGDVKQAPLVSGAVPEGQTPKVQRHD